jgi:hypothetical protein
VERDPAVLDIQVLHGIAPGATSRRVVASSRERDGKGLENGGFSERQGGNRGQRACKNWTVAGSARGVEAWVVDHLDPNGLWTQQCLTRHSKFHFRIAGLS